MKRFLFSLFILFGIDALSLVHSPFSIAESFAQDTRHRVASTIIADGLAQLPARNLDVLEQVMGEIVGTGSDGIASIADMMLPSGQGKNAVFEYAIDGLTNYATLPGREAQRDIVRQGLQTAIERCTDEGNRSFLQNQLSKLSPASQVVKHSAEDLAALAPNARAMADFRDKVTAMKPKKQTPFLLKTLKKSDDRQLRVTALELGDDALAEAVAKDYDMLSVDAQTDVLRWWGNRHDSRNLDIVLPAFSSADSTQARAAIEAAGRIGGESALTALIKALDGPYADAARVALTAYNGTLTADALTTLKEKGIVFTTGPSATSADGTAVAGAASSSSSSFQRAILSQEEAEAGFELLFDGISLDKWKGNKTSYIPIDGAISVSAQYGAEGNLYTTKTYSDFVFRFEFCFLQSGINNGVGIRTREGVDAAYDGMEIQILDHDAPIYKDLRPYQQHGAVYGIIVPEHVTFGELGTWNTEEIRAVGDHITVTVNGKVILDGNIREACQGHNMAPEEGKPNPYTVDHQSHPGLFNREGLISFCGHGEGLKLRNIRILDLSK